MSDRNNELVAKRWAKALMDLAQEDENISKEDILDDLNEISDTIDTSEELNEVINNPAISVEEKQIVLCKLFQNSIMPIVYNFLFVLNLRKRVNIISSIDLANNRKDDIKHKISEKLRKEVVVDWDVDSDIIAGLVLNIDETIVDNSIRHKLENLSNSIIKG